MATGASDVRAGGAWYELYGKDKLSAVLEGAKKKAESVAGAMKSLGKKAGGGAEAVLDGIKGGLQGLAMQFGQEAFKGIVSLIGGLEDLKKEYEKTARTLAQLDALTERNMARRAELIEAQIDPAKKKLAIDKEIAKLQEEDSASRGIKEQFVAQKDRTGMWKKQSSLSEAWQGARLWLAGGQEDAIANLQAHIDHENAVQDKLNARILDLNEQRGRILHPDKDPEKIKAVDELTKELNKQAATFNMAASAAKAYEMQLDNFHVDQIKKVRDAMLRLESIKNVSGIGTGILDGFLGVGPEIRDQIKDLNVELKKQADLWNAAADEVALYELRAKGASEAALAGAKAQIDRAKLLGILGGAADALANGVASTERATLASMGTFSGVGASQMFGGDTIDKKQLKAAEATAKNTEAAVKAVDRLAQGLRFK